MKHCLEKAIFAVLKTIKNIGITMMRFLNRTESPPETSAQLAAPESDLERFDPVTEITLKRFCYHPKGTLGLIDLHSERFYTVERPWANNAPNISCIPVGSYEMGWRQSPRFGETWHIKNVEARTHILIHVANYPSDVQGCIGLGTALMDDKIAVSHSRDAIKKFESLTRDISWRLTIQDAPYAALSEL